MNNISETNMSQHIDDGDGIDIKEIFRKLTQKWIWFVISTIICLLIAFLFVKYSSPVYQINAKLLVSDNEKGGAIGNQSSSLMDLGGLLGSKNSVDNEMEVLKTRFLMEQVVREMQLNITYSKKNNLIEKEIYESPLKLVLINAVDTIKYTKLYVSVSQQNKLSVEGEKIRKDVVLNEPFKVDGIGLVKIVGKIAAPIEDGLLITVSSVDDRVAALMDHLSVSVVNKQVSIIDLVFNYSLPQKGENILNTIISKYTEANLSDKNAIADSTYRFIEARLSVIATELGDVENKVENFKQKNQLSDMTEQGKLLVQNTSEFSSELAKSETQISVLEDLEKYLKGDNKNNRVFPSSLIPSDIVFSNLMNQYNSLLIEREKQLLSVTEESPFVQNIDAQISGLKKDILSNIQTTKNSYILTRNKSKEQLSKAEARISDVPVIEKNYLQLARNQKIKQELYIFLMQKAEETAISKTSNLSFAKVIDPPKAQPIPISPKKKIVFIIALAMGLVFPVVLILVGDFLNVTVNTKEDILSLTNVPVIGEISHNDSSDNLIVANHGRSAISEQFRALRTNLSFYLKTSSEKIILLTSSMSGEGKSFTAINLANILALAGKKVLLMELDLRKPGLSAKLGVSNDLGFSNYTITPELAIQNLIKPLDINKNMFIISSGPLPPNPAETLMSDRMPALIVQLKQDFDYIIMDAPPIGIITDAQLLSVYADATLYLVRQKITRKEQLKIVQDLYLQKKMKNIGIVVNDINKKNYGYGYNYGEYGQSEKKSAFSWLNFFGRN